LFALARKIEDNAGEIVEDTSISVGKAVVAATPVLTGFARSNWVASKGSVPNMMRRPARGQVETVEEIRTAVNGVGADGTVTIANGGEKVPYLGRLNAGSSAKAPAGFVKIAALAGAAAAAAGTLLRRRRRRR
jgi:hypothetical protein